ncbi:BTAD domain-containing putative transcriptional regulator [Nonomuraea sp. NPDC050556]|uniref:AfsR/SARP family transcriptional regulator n=1 Tax=Nonomuraea sp. NPDC050556 TaxID=3364369 RepID=UPI0037AD9A7D
MSAYFRVLGTVEVLGADGQPVPGAAPRHRAVLAYLLLHARTVISAERIIGAVWGQDPPDTARSQIQASIAAIRQVLRRAGAGEVLETRSAGYVILPEPGRFDLDEFAELAGEAGDRTAQVDRLRRALALWRGQPLSGIGGGYVEQARARLVERRLAAFERLAELELGAGRHAALVDELAALAADHPLRERLTGQLMLALHRSGRQVDALAAARAFRERLADEQGLDPSRTFADLERTILNDVPAPDFLPYGVPDFSGRAEELDRLVTSDATVSAIDGMAGVGKTTLAVHAAHRLAPRFPDGRLFVDLHAHTSGQVPLAPAAALEILLRQLGVPAERLPASPDELSALWRAELAGRRVLAVLDNAADADQVRPLLPGSPGSLVLITSRRRLVDLDGAHAMSVDVPPAADAVTLFTRIVGARAAEEPEAVLEVLRLCGFLPLAVRIAAARLLHRPRWNVAYLAERLREKSLLSREHGVAAAFAMSYEQVGPHQQRMFRLLGLHRGPDIEPQAAAALAGLPPDRAEALMEDLLDVHMLLQHEPGRYTFHDLLREHARAMATRDEAPEALERLFAHYLSTAARAGAGAWLDAERANLVASGGDHWPAHTRHQAIDLYRHLNGRGHYADALTLHTKALRVTGEPGYEARTLLALGATHQSHGLYGEAAACFRRAQELYRELGDRHGADRAGRALAEVTGEGEPARPARTPDPPPAR